MIPEPFTWPVIPFPALVTAVAVAIMTMVLLAASHYLDSTNGLLTISVMVVAAFTVVVIASLIYSVPQTPVVEILIGALSTSLGAVVAYWMGKGREG